ncbi:Lipoate--protein ligase 1 [bacterium HR32]|nr:Lipoate--protein ligase 1 [bacterium HR32]
MIDFGDASPLRSQTLWHAVAYGVSRGAPPTLSFVRPAAPYVSIGRTRSAREVDLTYCRRAGLPVYRRMVGGGPVYLDPHQLFFQITVPARRAPPTGMQTLRALLSPAVRAFRACGVPAALDSYGEVAVGDRKICGHAGGQVEEAVVVVGNLIEEFPAEQAARVLDLPHPRVRAEVERQVGRYVLATPVDPDRFKSALVRSYADALGLRPEAGGLSVYEHRAVRQLDRLFESPRWLWDVDGSPEGTWRVKIRAGVWVCAVQVGSGFLMASGVEGRVVDVAAVGLVPRGARHDLRELAASLKGARLDEAICRLQSWGEEGSRLAAAWSRAAALAV